jgi:hypothetical protein
MDLPNSSAHKNDFSGPSNNFPDNDNNLMTPHLPTPEPHPPTPVPHLPTLELHPPTPVPCLPTPELCLPTPVPHLPTPELCPPTPVPHLPTLEPHPPIPDAHMLQQQPEHGIKFKHRQPLNINIEALAQLAVLPKIQETFEFILALKNASLEDPVAKMNDEVLERLWNPPKVPLEINNPGICHSISMYLALEHASQDVYNRVHRSMLGSSNYIHLASHLRYFTIPSLRSIRSTTANSFMPSDLCVNTKLPPTTYKLLMHSSAHGNMTSRCITINVGRTKFILYNHVFTKSITLYQKQYKKVHPFVIPNGPWRGPSEIWARKFGSLQNLMQISHKKEYNTVKSIPSFL